MADSQVAVITHVSRPGTQRADGVPHLTLDGRISARELLLTIGGDAAHLLALKAKQTKR